MEALGSSGVGTARLLGRSGGPVSMGGGAGGASVSTVSVWRRVSSAPSATHTATETRSPTGDASFRAKFPLRRELISLSGGWYGPETRP
jgi:hypothetical protein